MDLDKEIRPEPEGVVTAEQQVLRICPKAILHSDTSREKLITYTVMHNGRAMAACSFTKENAWRYALEKIQQIVDKPEVHNE